jgi:hypothetical protein
MRSFLIVMVLLLSCCFAQAQWNTSGTNIINSNTGNVGIGTSNPQAKLEVDGGLYVNGGKLTQTVNLANDNSASFVNTSITGYGLFSQGGNGGKYVFHFLNQAGATVLYANSSNGYVGIGSINPQARLDVAGGANFSGKVGIGITSPTANLQVGAGTENGLVNFGGYAFAGSLRSSGDFFAGTNAYTEYTSSLENTKIKVYNTNASGSSAMQLAGNGDINFFTKAGNVTANQQLNIDANNAFKISGNGNIGIGTVAPGSRFTVAQTGYSGTPAHTSLAFINQSSNASGADLKPALELNNGGGSGYGLVSVASYNYFSGMVGIGPTTPLGTLHVNVTRPVIIKNNGGNGVYGSEIGFNSILDTNVQPNKFKKLGGTSQQGAASVVVDNYGNMNFQMYNAGTESESIINYTPQITFSNNGYLGVAAPNPITQFQVNSTRPVLIKNNGGNGMYGSEIGFNSILDTNVQPNKFKKLGGTSQQGGASVVVDNYGNMNFQMYNAGTESESIINYTPQITFSNNGYLGVAAPNPITPFQVNSIRPVLIKNNGSNGVYGSEIGFNAMLDTNTQPNKFKKLGGTSQKGGAAIVVDYYGNMMFQTYAGVDETEKIIDYLPQFIFSNNGKLGLGTVSPGAQLTVALPGYTGTPTHTSLAFINQSSNPNGTDLKPALEVGNNGGSGYGVVSVAANNYFTGNVGIGSRTPEHKLDVKGTVHAEEVKVDVNVPGPDYVFEADYNLTSLSEIETYVKENKHLPEVPSSKQMEEDGLNLKEMNLLLLKKVEELTLYLIEQNKHIEKIDTDNSDLKGLVYEQAKQIKSLKKINN